MKDKTYKKALDKIKKIRRKLIWTTRMGEEVLIKDMEDSHVKNTIIYISKRQDEYTKYKLGVYEINGMEASEWVEIFREELAVR